MVKGAAILIEEEGQPRMRRLGLSHEEMAKENPGLVYCTITPYGEKGPLRNQPASELTLQAMSDFLNMLGVQGEEPVRMGPDLVSQTTSLFASHGILGALYHKWRTGEGQHVKVSMLGSILFQRGINWLGTKDPDEWNGFVDYIKPPDHGYQAMDRRIILNTIRKEEGYRAALRALGMERYLEDPLFQRPPMEIMGLGGASGSAGYQAKPIWESVFSSWKAEELVDLLCSFGSSAAVMNSYEDLLSNPQVKEMGMFREATVPTLGKVKFMAEPWKLDGVPTRKPEPYVP